MGYRKPRYGLTGDEVTHIASWWDKMVQSHIRVEFGSFDDFALWTKNSGWEYGMKLFRKNLNEPYSPNNCQWQDVPISKSTLENRKEMAQQWDDFITPIRERYATELERIEQPKRVFFQYEHPDLVREGLCFISET